MSCDPNIKISTDMLVGSDFTIMAYNCANNESFMSRSVEKFTFLIKLGFSNTSRTLTIVPEDEN